MKILFIINEAPYGSEKTYNAVWLAMTIQKEHSDAEVRIFLMGDAVTCAMPNQNTLKGYYNIERMFKTVIYRGGHIKVCGMCAKARGMAGVELIEGVEFSSIGQMAQWVMESDKVLTF